MANDKKEVSAVEIPIDEFLRRLKDVDNTMKTMFRHFHVNVKGIEKATEAEFSKLLEAFKKLPISELK